MADVFISYASDDRARVEPLAQALEGAGGSCRAAAGSTIRFESESLDSWCLAGL